jgi:hypothetical protein
VNSGLLVVYGVAVMQLGCGVVRLVFAVVQLNMLSRENLQGFYL